MIINMKHIINVLIGCEESQVVCKAFRSLNKMDHLNKINYFNKEVLFNTYSCDIVDCSGGYNEWHIKDDVINVISDEWMDNNIRWDLAIFHPPCERLTVTANRWHKAEYAHRFPNIEKDRDESVDFFMKLANCNIEHIAIENPVGIMSSRWRKPNQIVNPFWFGDPHPKRTCLWLKNLPLLKPSNMVEPLYYTYKNGKKDSIWHMESMALPKKERSKIRSKTFQGFADQMALQWGNYLLNKYLINLF